MTTFVFRSEVYVEAEDEQEAQEKVEYTIEADLYNNHWIEEVVE